MTLHLHDITVRFGPITALSAVSHDVPVGRMTAIIGPNAAGKSTLLRVAAGLLTPTAGAVQLDGDPLGRWSARRLAQRIAFVPQRPSIAAAFTVQEVVELGRFAAGHDPKRVENALAVCGLTDLAERVVNHLSVGQQQRVALARAIAQGEPGGYVMLDEPISAMDYRWAIASLSVLRHLADEGAGVLIVLHDLSLAAAFADNVWLMHEGRLDQAGPVDEVMRPETLERTFGVPFEWLETRQGGHALIADTQSGR